MQKKQTIGLGRHGVPEKEEDSRSLPIGKGKLSLSKLWYERCVFVSTPPCK